MSTVIYLSNQQIEIIEGTRGKTVTISRHLSLKAPEGTIINGMVMDAELFSGFIADVWKENKLSSKDVILLVNSTKFVGQLFEIPKMSDEKTLNYVKRGFSNIDKSEDKIYGYIRFNSSKKNMQRLYAESVSPEYLKNYIDLFENAGIKLKSIRSAESSLMNLATNTLLKYYNSFILLIADGMALGTMLFTDKEYHYYNSVRCFHEQGTNEYAQDLIRSVSQIRQFMQANQLETDIEAIFLAGMKETDLDVYCRNMTAFGLSKKPEMFYDAKSIKGDHAKNVQKYLWPTSALFDGGKCSDFLKLYREKGKNEKSANSLTSKKYLISIAATVLIMAVGFGLSLLWVKLKENELKTIDDYNNSASVMMQAASYDMLTERNSFLASQYLSIADINENLDTYPWATTEVISYIRKLAEGYAEISITSCNADNGTTNLTVMAENPQKISDFAAILSNQPLFYDVTYSGYSLTANGMYSVDISCILSEAAGRNGEGNEN